MTSKPLTPQLGRIIISQLEQPKRESAIVLEGFRWWDAWDFQRISGFLEHLAARGYIEREPLPGRTPGPWKSTPKGVEAATRGDFLADCE
jgi:hypothetical protein